MERYQAYRLAQTEAVLQSWIRNMKLGILGGGQLAQLLGTAAQSLGVDLYAYTQAKDDPASYTAKCVVGALSDWDTLKAFAEQMDVLSLENENIDPKLIKALNDIAPVHPGKGLACAQDRLMEKNQATELGIPCGAYYEVNSVEDLSNAMKQLPEGALKTRREGYDGKGQWASRKKAILMRSMPSVKIRPVLLRPW